MSNTTMTQLFTDSKQELNRSKV